MLERMLESDEIAAHVKQWETAFAAQKVSIAEERKQLARQVAQATASLESIAAERAALLPRISAPMLGMFERLVKHRGTLAVVEVRDGRCTACQVRVRPQVYNEIRRHEVVFQCESCQRILYFGGTYTALYAPESPDAPGKTGQGGGG